MDWAGKPFDHWPQSVIWSGVLVVDKTMYTVQRQHHCCQGYQDRFYISSGCGFHTRLFTLLVSSHDFSSVLCVYSASPTINKRATCLITVGLNSLLSARASWSLCRPAQWRVLGRIKGRLECEWDRPAEIDCVKPVSSSLGFRGVLKGWSGW